MLGYRIAHLRREKGYTQAQLAQLLHISASALGMYEQGRRVPGAETLVELSTRLQVSVDYLLTGNDYVPFEKAGSANVQCCCGCQRRSCGKRSLDNF